jgi:putative intracellular protease/amidase
MTTSTPRILVLTTSHARLGDTGKPTGVWLEELALPMQWLAEQGAMLNLASVAGGAIPLDPASLPPADAPQSDLRRRFLSEHAALLTDSPATAHLHADHFDALFLPGGHGTVWDLPDGAAPLVEAFYAAGKPIAAVCHGPAGLVGARRADGQALVTGLRVNAFTDHEERLAGLEQVVPFLLESRLSGLGARFEAGPAWAPYCTQDVADSGSAIITGQNPASSLAVAQALWAALAGRE